MTESKYGRFHQIVNHICSLVGDFWDAFSRRVETQDRWQLQQSLVQEQDAKEKRDLEKSTLNWKSKFRYA